MESVSPSSPSKRTLPAHAASVSATSGTQPAASVKILSKKWQDNSNSFGKRFKSLCHKNFNVIQALLTLKTVNFHNPFGSISAISFNPKASTSVTDDTWQALLKDVSQYLGKEAWGLLADGVNFIKSVRDIKDVWQEKSKIYEASQEISLEEPGPLSGDKLKDLLTQCQSVKDKLVHTVTNPKALLTEKVEQSAIIRLGWSCMMFVAEGLAMISKLIKMLAIARVPFAYALGQSIEGLAYCLRAGLQVRSQTSGVFAISRAFANAAEVSKALNKTPLHARDAMSTLNDAEKKGILKAIRKQQKTFERFVALVDQGLGITSSLVAAASVTIAILTALGAISGMALAIFSPLGWAIGGLAIGMTLTYGAFCLARYFHNYYKQGLWEECLEGAGKGPVISELDLKSRGKVYQSLYESAKTKIKDASLGLQDTPEAINTYIQKRALTRLLQLDGSLLLETIYQSIQPGANEQDLGEYLSKDVKILSPDLVAAIRTCKSGKPKYEKAHKPYLMRELTGALAM